MLFDKSKKQFIAIAIALLGLSSQGVAFAGIEDYSASELGSVSQASSGVDDTNVTSQDALENTDSSRYGIRSWGRTYVSFGAGLSGATLGVDYGSSSAGVSGGNIYSGTGLLASPHPAISISIGYKMDKFQHFGCSVEFFTQWSFGSIDMNITPTNNMENYTYFLGDGYQYIGGFFKPFVALYDKKVNIYGLLGGGYLFFSGQYSNSSSQASAAGPDVALGRGVLSYGVGLSIETTDRTEAFIQFVGIAPIYQNTADFGSNSTVVYANTTTAISTYTLSMGLTVKM